MPFDFHSPRENPERKHLEVVATSSHQAESHLRNFQASVSAANKSLVALMEAGCSSHEQTALNQKLESINRWATLEKCRVLVQEALDLIHQATPDLERLMAGFNLALNQQEQP